MRAMGPAHSVAVSDVLSGAGAGALALVALADLGTTYAGWAPLASRPWLATAAGAGLALAAIGSFGSILPRARALAWRGAIGELRTSWAAREAILALALALVATAFVAGLALDVRPRRMWALAAGTMLLAWAVLACAARARSVAVPFGDLLLAHASGAVIVEAVVRPEAGATWVAAAGLGLLVAALVAAEERRRQAGTAEAGRHASALRAAFFVAAIAVPALWLVAGLGERAPGIAAAACCLAGMAAGRWLDSTGGGIADPAPDSRGA